MNVKRRTTFFQPSMWFFPSSMLLHSYDVVQVEAREDQDVVLAYKSSLLPSTLTAAYWPTREGTHSSFSWPSFSSLIAEVCSAGVCRSGNQKERIMTNFIRFAVGIVGNATSLLMYGAPILTFRRVIKKRSTEDFSGIPYAIALLNCLLYTWYGTPLVSYGSENVLVATVNGIGIILEWFFVCTYFIFAQPKAKRNVARMFAAVLLLFGIIAAVSLLALHDHGHRKLLVGSVAMAVTVVMYGSPLSVIRLVIRTKSVEFMPFYLSLFSFLTSAMWTTYGILGRDMIMASPNIVGLPLGLLQIAVYCYYRNGNKHPTDKDGKFDQPDPEMGLKQNKGATAGSCTTEKEDSLAEDYVEMQIKANETEPIN